MLGVPIYLANNNDPFKLLPFAYLQQICWLRSQVCIGATSQWVTDMKPYMRNTYFHLLLQPQIQLFKTENPSPSPSPSKPWQCGAAAALCCQSAVKMEKKTVSRFRQHFQLCTALTVDDTARIKCHLHTRNTSEMCSGKQRSDHDYTRKSSRIAVASFEFAEKVVSLQDMVFLVHAAKQSQFLSISFICLHKAASELCLQANNYIKLGDFSEKFPFLEKQCSKLRNYCTEN